MKLKDIINSLPAEMNEVIYFRVVELNFTSIQYQISCDSRVIIIWTVHDLNCVVHIAYNG